MSLAASDALGRRRGSLEAYAGEPRMSWLTRHSWRVLALVCVSIGAVNAFLPLLPTTVSWIVAA